MEELVIVSGAPGSGKSMLALPLARDLGLPLLSKDTIKESLFDHLDIGAGVAAAWSKQLGAASMHLIWALATYFPGAVLEANFRPHSDYERQQILTLGGRVVEVYCSCPIELAALRFEERAKSRDHHPTHIAERLDPTLAAEFDGPMGVGSLVEVDTSTVVDGRALAREVSLLLGREAPSS